MSARIRPLIFGEVLFDRFPDGNEVLGGAPFNVAWNLRGLGLDPILVSRVGEDPLGERILGAMGDFGLDTVGIQLDPEHPTGTVEVQLRDDEPRFEIVPDRAYDFIDPDRALPNAGVDGVGVPLIYHGSLALRNARSAAAARAVIQVGHQAGSGVFFDVNLRPPWWQREQVEEWMRVADHIKLNEAELASLLPEIDDLEARASGLLSRTGAAAVYVTMGAEGARAFTREGATHSIRPTRSPKLADTVGAGDAFSSVLILGLLREWPLESSLHRAQEFAEAVVELHGATTIDPGFYSRYQKIWGIS